MDGQSEDRKSSWACEGATCHADRHARRARLRSEERDHGRRIRLDTTRISSPSGKPRIGHAVLAIDPEALAGSAGYFEAPRSPLTRMLEEGGRPAPGSRRHAAACAAREEGIKIPDPLLNELRRSRRTARRAVAAKAAPTRSSCAAARVFQPIDLIEGLTRQRRRHGARTEEARGGKAEGGGDGGLPAAGSWPGFPPWARGRSFPAVQQAVEARTRCPRSAQQQAIALRLSKQAQAENNGEEAAINPPLAPTRLRAPGPGWSILRTMRRAGLPSPGPYHANRPYPIVSMRSKRSSRKARRSGLCRVTGTHQGAFWHSCDRPQDRYLRGGDPAHRRGQDRQKVGSWPTRRDCSSRSVRSFRRARTAGSSCRP